MLHQHTTTTPLCLKAIVDKLRAIDDQLLRLSESIPGDGPLPAELRGGIEVVRTDLLSDAIETLAALAQLNATSATQRYLEAVDTLERSGRRITADRPILGRPEAIAEYLIKRHTCLDQEILGAVYVDAHHRLIADVEIFRGALLRLAVEPRVILRQALERGAAGFLLWHTHPSGDPSPTPEDLAFTRRLAKSARLLGVELIDHLILGEPGRWISIKRCGGWDGTGRTDERGHCRSGGRACPSRLPESLSSDPLRNEEKS